MECVLGTLCAKAFIAKTDTSVNQPLNLRDFWPRQRKSLHLLPLPSSSPIAIGMLSIITGFEGAGAQNCLQRFLLLNRNFVISLFSATRRMNPT